MESQFLLPTHGALTPDKSEAYPDRGACFQGIVMARLAPPQPPLQAAMADDDGLHRVRLRCWQLGLTALTVLITAWCCTLGWGPAVIALVIAKHILVAILMMGLGVDAGQST
jgi:hypothetical protein